MCWEASREFVSDILAPGSARRFCADQLLATLSDHPERAPLIDDVTLIISELTTNAVNAGGSRIRVSLTLHRAYLQLSVADDAPGLPVLRAASADEPDGRGLAITQSLSNAWGVEPTPFSLDYQGKRVWVGLQVVFVLTQSLDCHR